MTHYRYLFAGFEKIEVTTCKCQTLGQLLVSNGLFPTAPSYPRTAVSTDLLDFYQALFEQSCDAVHALATALQKFYTRRGYRLNNAGVSYLLLIPEPQQIYLSREELYLNHSGAVLAMLYSGTIA